MKKTIATLAVFATFAIPAATAFAQATTAPAAPAAAQGPCSEESKTAIYTEFTTLRTTDATKAYEAAKKYLACAAGVEDQYTAYLKKWSTAYEKESRKVKMVPLLYGDKKYAEALGIGKEILADEPENLRVIIDLGYGSYLAAVNLKQESFNADALNYARKAIQLIESGKAPASWAPFKGKDDTLAYLYDVVGRLSLKDNPAAALTSLIKKAQFETDLKKDPWTYFFIAAAYESGPYAKQSADYKSLYEGKDETPESKLALANINQVVDRMIDAYARAVAVAGNDTKYATQKKEWMDSLATWYKYRNTTDAGLDAMIASVLSKPLPPEPTPLTTLPATTTTPTSGSSNAAGASNGSSVMRATTGAAPRATTGAAPPATTGATPPATTGATPPATTAATPPATTGATPSTTTGTAAKPRPRNNHARRN